MILSGTRGVRVSPGPTRVSHELLRWNPRNIFQLFNSTITKISTCTQADLAPAPPFSVGRALYMTGVHDKHVKPTPTVHSAMGADRAPSGSAST